MTDRPLERLDYHPPGVDPLRLRRGNRRFTVGVFLAAFALLAAGHASMLVLDLTVPIAARAAKLAHLLAICFLAPLSATAWTTTALGWSRHADHPFRAGLVVGTGVAATIVAVVAILT